MGSRVMVVEDERIVAFDLQQRLQSLGYEIAAVAASGDEALRKVAMTHPDLVLMDIRIDGKMDGIETALELQKTSSVPVVFLTAHHEDSTLDRARRTRPYGYLLKPFTEREMHATIQMAIERHRFESALARSEQRLRLALDAADMGILDIDTETLTADIGGRSAQILGLSDTPTHTSCATLLSCVDAEDRDRVRVAFRRSMERDDPYEIEFRRTLPDGRRRWIRADGRGFPGRRPRARMVGVLQDITEQKITSQRITELNDELERTVRARTAELQASLEELNAFSYSVAHDLRAPLRAVLGFSERLKEDFSAQIDEEGQHFIDRVHAAGRRMAEVIDALLALAHLTRVELRREHVNLSEMVDREMQQLAEENPQRAVEYVVARDVLVDADPALLRLVVENLLRNAWKFTSKHPTARVEFGRETTPNGSVYFVTDDGAGFDMSRSSQLFVPFRRLHLARDFEGIGVGLATVQRIVVRHGGTIWAESAPEKGARFNFTLGEAVPQG